MENSDNLRMENILYELTPNIKKAFMFSIGKVLVVAGIFLGGFYYLSSMGIFDIFIELLNEMELDVTQNFINISFPVGVSFVALVAIGLNYMSLHKVRYVCYVDHISIYRNFMIFQVSETNIPYWNIKGIETDNAGMENKLFNTGAIRIEASGTKKGFVKLEYIDYPEQVELKIQEIIRNFKANYYADYIKKQRIKSIAEQY